MSLARQRHSMRTAEARNVAVSFAGKLDEGESLVDPVTITKLSGAGTLTFTNQGVSTTALTINGASVPAGRAVQFKVSASEKGNYRIRIQAASDASPAQTLIVDIQLDVLD